MQNVLNEFSQELRRQCSRRGSIAQLCKSTGINRQQFNKYLSGRILPSVRNLRKICGYLGVTEAQLMSPGTTSAPQVQDPAEAPEELGSDDYEIDLSHISGLIARRLGAGPATSGTSANVLPEGCYDCYFPLFAASDSLVRWLLKVRRVGNGLTFSCRTYIRDIGGEFGPATRNKYHGIGLLGAREAYLIGTSRMRLHQPGILAINMLPVVGRNYFTALALTPRLDGPLAITAALHYRGSEGMARDVLSGLGIIKLSNPALDPVIAKLMRAVPAAGANWIQSVNGKSLRPDKPAEGCGYNLLTAQKRLAV